MFRFPNSHGSRVAGWRSSSVGLGIRGFVLSCPYNFGMLTSWTTSEMGIRSFQKLCGLKFSSHHFHYSDAMNNTIKLGALTLPLKTRDRIIISCFSPNQADRIVRKCVWKSIFQLSENPMEKQNNRVYITSLRTEWNLFYLPVFWYFPILLQSF